MAMPISNDRKINTSLTLSSKSIGIIDKNRGQQSRSSWVDEFIVELGDIV